MIRKPLTVSVLKEKLSSLSDTMQVLVDQIDGVEENFCPGNYVKIVEFGGISYVAIGRTLKPEDVE